MEMPALAAETAYDSNVRGTVFFHETWDVFKAALRMREIAQELSQFQTPQIASDLEKRQMAKHVACCYGIWGGLAHRESMDG